jgi:BirA family biotin operon repressor/biotin-[acetyl-CoA-carboxylase] ligase
MSGKAYLQGIEVIRLEETESTQEVTRHLLRERAQHAPLLVTARHQRAGRGRDDHRWLSSPGDDLLMSLLWAPRRLPAARQFALSMAAALATAQLVDLFVTGGAVKWPNDIIVSGKKIAGILIENTISGEHLDTTLIGIGVNINETSFPASLPDAISLRMLTGRDYDPDTLLETLTTHLLSHLQRIDNEELETLQRNYEERLYRRGETSLFRTEQGTLKAVITGIDEWGRLLLTTGDGITRPYGMEEVHQLL